MKHFVKMVESVGEKGSKREQFDTLVVGEIDPGTIHPEPSPLFDTPGEARAYGESKYPGFVESELKRLIDCGANEYNTIRGLENYHNFLKSEADRLAAPASEQPKAAKGKNG